MFCNRPLTFTLSEESAEETEFSFLFVINVRGPVVDVHVMNSASVRAGELLLCEAVRAAAAGSEKTNALCAFIGQFHGSRTQLLCSKLTYGGCNPLSSCSTGTTH